MDHKKFFWLREGQLLEGETLVAGFVDLDEAERFAKGLKGETKVNGRQTWENDRRQSDPNFDPDETIESARWCILTLA
jgi:hypothetical protein